MKLRLIASTLAVTAVVVVGLSGTASAAKGGKNAGAAAAVATISLAPGSQPWLGGTVTFTSVSPAGVKNPRISVRCFDAAQAVVFGETGTSDHVFVLGGGMSAWLMNPMAVRCSAELYEIVWNGNNPQEYTSYAMTWFDAGAGAP